jgi:hypothetical protein
MNVFNTILNQDHVTNKLINPVSSVIRLEDYGEFEMISSEAVMAYFKILSRNLHIIQKRYGILQQNSW